jgi:predicted acylesterase/phospholipase RssA
MVDTEVIRISPQSFEDLWNHPAIIRRMFKSVIHKSALTTEDSAPHTTQVIAIGSLGRNAVLSENIARMAGLFGQKRDVLFLDPSTIIELLNLPESALKDSEHLAWLRIRTWYTQTVAAHAYIVFALSPDYPAWNKFCRSNADTLVALADGTHQPARSMEHTWFEPIKAPLPQERWLVLVHPADADIPSGTRRWLDAYAAPRHIHIAGTGEGELLRVMRMVTGTGVGVVLGGGTSKGNAHFGVMRAIAEAGIPVDMICGTSIGSAIAAMFAARYSPEQIAAINQMLLDLNPFRDFAVPRTALLKHRKFEQLAKFSFKDICIEDMWLKYFCISTDLTTAEQIIHEEGETWRATMASGALPMVIPPFIEDRHVLVDGGLLNNVPADVMLQKTQGPVIAINVSPVEDWEVQEEAAPQHRSLMEKVRSPIQLKGNPGIMDVLVQSMVVSSHYKLRSVVNEVDLYLEPPVGHYGMTRFDAWQEMSQIGYEYALPLLTEFKNKHPKLQMI